MSLSIILQVVSDQLTSMSQPSDIMYQTILLITSYWSYIYHQIWPTTCLCKKVDKRWFKVLRYTTRHRQLECKFYTFYMYEKHIYDFLNWHTYIWLSILTSFANHTSRVRVRTGVYHMPISNGVRIPFKYGSTDYQVPECRIHRQLWAGYVVCATWHEANMKYVNMRKHPQRWTRPEWFYKLLE